MKVIYAPKGEEPQTFDLTLDDLKGAESELIEDAGGTQWETFGEWFSRLERDGYRARKVLAWVLLRKANPDLGFEELVGFKFSDLTFGVSDEDADAGKDPAGDGTGSDGSPTGSESPTPDSGPSMSN